MSRWPYNTAAWQRLRAAKLSNDPLCEACIRREVITPANTVDHILAIKKGGDPFPGLDGLMSLCAPCHNIKTNLEDRPDRQRKLGGAYKGSAVDGGALDPSDDWSAPAANVAPAKGYQAPGGFRSRRSAAIGPARYSKTELVSCESFATSNKEADKWV